MRRYSKLLSLLVCLAGAVSLADEPVQGETPSPIDPALSEHHEAHAMTPNEYIAHHVEDNYDWQFEYPGLFHAEAPVVHMGQLFSFLKFERTPGACGQAVDPKYAMVKAIGVAANGCFDMRPSKAHLMMFFAGFLVLAMGLAFGNRKKDALVPSGHGQNFWEAFIQFIRDEIAVKNIGPELGEKYVPFLATVFIFILTMNWLGLVPGFFSATGSITVTAGLAVCTFVLTQIAAIRSAGIGGYLAHLTGGMNEMVMKGPLYLRAIGFVLMLLFIPIEIVGLLVRPFVLTMRLFANMFAGHMVLFTILALAVTTGGVWYGFSFLVGTVIYVFETFVGLLQAFIFTLLSSIYIGLAVDMGHHGHDDAREGEGHKAAHH